MSPQKHLTVIATSIALGVGGCATNGEGGMSKQTMGSVLGAVGGAILGSQVGKGSGRNLAILAGALAGGALGNWLGAKLDERDRQALAASTQDALDSGRTVAWQSTHSGASATIAPVSSKTVSSQQTIRRAPKIATVQNMAVINQPYQAIKSSNLRAEPGTQGEKVGGFLAGQTFTALGRTDNDWIAVGRKGVTIGYVYGPLVGPVPMQAKDAPTDLDAISADTASAQGFDLDSIEPSAAVTEQVAVKTTCRTVDYRVKTADGEESKTVDACQSADGAWQLS
ncbi:SH3 domain-containing protein [Denitromonas ohlonensis]|uniref:SH3 domain-containing protein n=2 Tax=Denitromonas TaxID=139331 RepID=A0A557SQB2_9RHOO|nr:SH3 domain-containing protein [Denitromonas ohlonensis]TVO65979.1 SH3 domain-containing protein [Denitromonas ohlonensis]TVO79572.1 SH3 domain-containing protein [Denitromonas ohlonensis]